ncbi:hypothetical protein SH1V18_46700 [Vallitalea longa]|uniref:Uncharacterized protein n=1 Tax=Vallitalea longa TaxID=2936439 RepID=A0A9W6DH11_9FIRM|nr:ABC transporter substrate-binding protein [Vallitalea longa]GKX32190.1 hypothetical protein SH1V18_46700 [Vallitalea longa]
MKIKIVPIMILICFLIVGCENENNDSQIMESNDSEENTITFMVKVLDDKTITPLEKLIKEYNRTSSKKIVLEKVTYDKYQYILNMKMMSKDKPDIFMLDEDWLQTYNDKNWLLPINTYLSGKVDKSLENVIPLSMRTYRLIYNKDIFKEVGLDWEKPPVTLDELYKDAIKISEMKIGESYGFALYLKDKESGFQSLLENANKMNGIYYYDKENDNYNFSKYKEWFQVMMKINHQSGILQYATKLKKDNVIKQFAESNIGMMIISNEDYYWIDSQEDNNVGISSVPIWNQENIKNNNISIPGILIGVNSKSDSIDEIVDFCKALTSREWGIYMYEKGYIIPTYNVKLKELDELLNTNTPREFLPDKEMYVYETNKENKEYERQRFDIYFDIITGERPIVEGLNTLNNIMNEINDSN